MRRWESKLVRVGMTAEEWKRIEAVLDRIPGRSKAERLGRLLLLGALLVEEEGAKVLARLLK